MTVERRTVSGSRPDGSTVIFEVVDITLPTIHVSLLSLGAAIHTVEVPDRQGTLGPVHLHLPSVQDYADIPRNPHLGATVGRYANRIAGGEFTLDGTTFHLDINRPPNTLHGGLYGFDRQVWRVADVVDGASEAVITFALHSPDGDMGFPGNVEATTTYAVSPGRIAITMSATTDAPTPVSMANHGYWNLDGSQTITHHRLDVHAHQRLTMDDTGIPVGITDVAGTPYDLLTPTELGPVIEATGGLDDCYLVNGTGMRVAARLQGAFSGRQMTVTSDAPGLQVYTGNGLHPPFHVHQSVSLEAQRLPDAPNQPSLGACILRPGESYSTTTLIEFSAISD